MAISKHTFKLEGPKAKLPTTCVGCGKTVPFLHHTGSVIAGMRFMDIESVRRVDTEWITEVKRVGFLGRKKGALCDSCASEYRTVTDRSGRKHPMVKTDPLPGSLGTLKIPLTERHIENRSEERVVQTRSEVPVSTAAVKNTGDNQWLNVGRRK
jgi:hypothetical protein